MKTQMRGLLAAVLSVIAVNLYCGPTLQAADAPKVPGQLHCSWIANSFDGKDKWVQNALTGLAVSPDGVVVAYSAWDEAGRCVGLYKDGDVNTKLLQQYNGKGGHSAWGWGTAGVAAVDGSFIYLANASGELLRFKWTPGNINSASYVDLASISDHKGKESDQEKSARAATCISARNGKLYIVQNNGDIQVRQQKDLSKESTLNIPGATQAVADAEGNLWVLAKGEVGLYSAAGKALAKTIDGLGHPVALAFGNKEPYLIICDDGPRQQVLFYDVSGVPKLVKAFGAAGGIGSGTPGEAKPTKFFCLKGAGTDSQGNIYVGMGYTETIIRKFKPDGTLVWDLQSMVFGDNLDFRKSTDGNELYSKDALYTADYSKTPGQQFTLKAITRDRVKDPKDPRTYGTSIIRERDGHKLLYEIGMYSGGFGVYYFDAAPSEIAHYALNIGLKGETWAWEVDDDCTVWCGNGPNGTILKYPLQGFDAKGAPQYSVTAPEKIPYPEPFVSIQRLRYLASTDTMYISGDTATKKVAAWGLTGAVLARYENWSKGGRKAKWVIELPVDAGKLQPKAFDAAGDYVFAVSVGAYAGSQGFIHVYRAADGTKSGAIYPDPKILSPNGWVDIPFGIRVMQRKNGEYLILTEDDYRAKNVVYRWKP